MAKLSRYAMVLVLWGFSTVPLSFSGPEQHLSTPPPPPSFEADLLRIDGNRYVVKDSAGMERQVLVGKDTEIFGQAKAKPATAFKYGSSRMDMLKPSL